MQRSKKHLIFLIGAFLVILIFFVYVQLWATFDQKEFIAIYNVDKILHAIGGVFIVSTLQYIWPNKKIGYAAAVLLLGTLVWEVFEWIALPDVREAFTSEHLRWKVDTIQDVVVGTIAGLIYLFTARYGKGKDTLSSGPAMQPIGGTNAFINAQKEQKERGKQQIINMLSTKPQIQNNDVEKLLGVSDATATNYLQELEDEGKIKQIGEVGRGVSYKING